MTGTNRLTGNTSIVGVNNLCVEIASADVTAVHSVTFSGLSSSNTYRAVYSATFNDVNSYLFGLVVDADYAANYGGIFECTRNAGESYVKLPTYGMLLNWDPDANKFPAGNTMTGTVTIGTLFGRGWANAGIDQAMYYDPTRYNVNKFGNGFHKVVGLSSISFVGSSADVLNAFSADQDFSGHFELWKCGYTQVP
jgi:hypothetical protein